MSEPTENLIARINILEVENQNLKSQADANADVERKLADSNRENERLRQIVKDLIADHRLAADAAEQRLDGSIAI